MINRINFFDQPVNNDEKVFGTIRKITNGQRDDYATSCVRVYAYFKMH